MLQTRLWMGTILVLLTVGMLVVDQHLAPWYPFLFVFVVVLSLGACKEMVGLLGRERPVHPVALYVGVLAFAAGNWVAHAPGIAATNPWSLLAGLFAGLVLLVFVLEMAVFQPPSDAGGAGSGAIGRMSRTIWVLAYLGLLPCFFAQLRWLYPANQPEYGSIALALAIFVPKGCDIGAYCTGRLIGRHPMTPVLSPKKTWEGAAGGLVFAILIAIGIDRFGPAPLLDKCLGCEIAFGLALGVAGMLGDLAESLIKRDCGHKDASAAVPGFGGVLDVVDSVIFAAPIGYLWLAYL